MVKRLVSLLIALAAFMPVGVHALESYDVALIYRNMQIISNHVNQTHDSDSLESIMAPGKDALLGEINKKVANKTVHFSEKVVTITETGKDQVRVEGTFEAEGNDGTKNWKNDGRNYFVFKKVDGKWLLSDTDFYKALEVDKASAGVSWFGWVPWILLLLVVAGMWIFVLKKEQRKAISRRVWIIIAAIWRFVAKLVRGTIAKRAERKRAQAQAEPEIISETPMEFENEDVYDEPMESAALSPKSTTHEPDVEVHHFQENAKISSKKQHQDHENKVEHISDEEQD